MSLKFPSIRPDEKEIIEPDDLNLNLKQFTDELNGNLTHENLSQDVTLKDDFFKKDSFTQTYQSAFSDDSNWGGGTTAFKCSKQHVGYSRVDENDNKMPSIDFVAERDGYIIVDFMFSISWTGSGLLTEDDISLLVVDKSWPANHEDYYACCFPDSSGRSGQLAPGGWTGIGGTSTGFEQVNMSLGSRGSAFGEYKRYDVHSRNFPQGKWWPTPVDNFAFRARVVCNGVEICESGWLHNGTDRNSAFITGVLPVRAGRNEIRAEVSAAMLQSIYGASVGVRAVDEETGSGRGKFFPKSFYSSRDVAHPLPKSRKYTINQGKGRGDVCIDLGINCLVHAANMVVQFRKA